MMNVGGHQHIQAKLHNVIVSIFSFPCLLLTETDDKKTRKISKLTNS